jgi:hypothetical protein
MAALLSEDVAGARAPAEVRAELERMIDGADAARRRPVPARRPLTIALAGAAMSALALGVFWFFHPRAPRPAWDVTRIEGAPRIGSKTVGEVEKLGVGEWLLTDDSSRAKIDVGEIGYVQVDPGSRVRLVEAKADEHRLALARGKMEAFIWAPPRQFYVDTPSAVAVD